MYVFSLGGEEASVVRNGEGARRAGDGRGRAVAAAAGTRRGGTDAARGR